MTYGRKPIGTIAYLGGLLAVPEAFTHAWGQLIQYNAEYVVGPAETIYYTRATVSLHAFARNCLAEAMRGDWLLMLDADMDFEPDLAARLLAVFERDKLDVLTGIYCHKAPPHSPVLYKWAKGGERMEHLGDWDKPAGGRYLVPVAGAGAGVLLVRRRVFERIRAELTESPFDIRHPYGEDLSFFVRCKQLGIQAYCDPAVQAYHLTARPIVPATDYVPDRALIGPREEVAV